ncbi:DNA repair protein [Pseudomonas syringae]|nr:DNA repair protein [Pseudomonas syringae]
MEMTMATLIFRRNTKIGNLDAETDTFLKSCFLETDVYSNLLSFEDGIDFAKRIIVGRTGSGKTALIKQLSENPKIKKHLTIEAESTVFEHIKNNVFISKLIDNNVDLRIFYKSLWIHVLLVKVVELLYPGKNFFEMMLDLPTTGKKKYNATLAKEYVEKFKDNFFNESIVSEITEKMQLELAGGFTLPPAKLDGKANTELTEKIQRATAQYVSTELLRKQKELIKVLTEEKSRDGQHRFIISIDDLDKSWLSSSEIRYDFINSLLDAFKELLDIKTVKIIISIRTDIIRGIYLKNLRQEEKDKSLILDIHWDKLQIQKILDNRIDFLIKDKYQSNATTRFSDIFSFPIKNEVAQDYILRRTMLRPRDAIDFVNLCLSEADGSTALNENQVIEAEEKFYVSRKQALCKEWASIFPQITRYINGLAEIETPSFFSVDIQDKIEQIQMAILSYTQEASDTLTNDMVSDFNLLLNIWFIVGVIGIKKSESLIIYSSFEKQELDISDYKKEFFIHPLFFRY